MYSLGVVIVKRRAEHWHVCGVARREPIEVSTLVELDTLVLVTAYLHYPESFILLLSKDLRLVLKFWASLFDVSSRMFKQRFGDFRVHRATSNRS